MCHYQIKKNFFLIFILLFSQFVFGERIYTHEIPDELEIRLSPKNYKKYINLLTDEYISDERSIHPKSKKFLSFNGSYINENKISKTFSGKFRITGDWKDHLNSGVDFRIFSSYDWRSGINDEYLSSLSFKINKGNFGGVVKFRLLHPHTRNHTNEILWSLLMEELGFYVPYRKYVKVNFNGLKKVMIFEEKPEKEFLESYGIRETPILEVDERQLFEFYNHDEDILNLKYYPQLVFKNTGFLKNQKSLEIIKRSLNPYIFNQKIEFSKNDEEFGNSTINNESELVGFYDELQRTYNVAYHGVAVNNRKFIYDGIYNLYYPIYFDGNVDIINHSCNLIDEQKIENHLKYKLNILESKFSKRTLGRKLSKKDFCFSAFILKNFETPDFRRIRKLDFKSSDSILEITPFKISKNYFYPKIIELQNNDTIKKCSINNRKLSDCKDIDKSKLKKIVSGNSSPEIIDNFKLYPLLKINYPFPKEDEEEIIEKNIINEELKIHVKNNQKIFLKGNIENSKVSVTLGSENSKVVFNDSKITNSEIEVIGNYKLDKKYLETNYDNRLLTGCLTIINSQIQNITLRSTNCYLEDSINIVRSSGVISSIEIEHSNSDALDADFSNLYIENIKIFNAKNDCIDLSGGVYNFNKADVSNCGDKGISVGENSISTIQNLKTTNTSISVAVKDYSDLSIISHKNSNSKNCIQAYQKKQEFGGGTIRSKKLKSCFIELDHSSRFLNKDICSQVERNQFYSTCITKDHIFLNINFIPKESRFFSNNKYIMKSLNNKIKNCQDKFKCEIKISNKTEGLDKSLFFGLTDKDKKYFYSTTNINND